MTEINYNAPAGYEMVGFYCHRGSGHFSSDSCKSDSIPIFVQNEFAAGVRQALLEADVFVPLEES